MKTETRTEDYYEVCSLCDGRGQEQVPTPCTPLTSPKPFTAVACRGCGGTGQKLVKTIKITSTIYES